MIVLSMALVCLLCSSAFAREDSPLKWKLQRWEYIVIVQGGEQVGDGQARHTHKKIVTMLRGKKDDLPRFEWWRHRHHAMGKYYLMCYHKAPPGTSAWQSFNVRKTEDGFTILKFHTKHDTTFYGTTAKYDNMTLEEFKKLLKPVPFESQVEKTHFHKAGMIKSNKQQNADAVTAEKLRQQYIHAKTRQEWLKAKKQWVANLKKRYAGIDASVSGPPADEHGVRFSQLMMEWNPIHCSAEDLKSIAGKPTRENADMLYYAFDNGADGTYYRFTISGGTIFGVEYIPGE